jgi:hypothetical protein
VHLAGRRVGYKHEVLIGDGAEKEASVRVLEEFGFEMRRQPEVWLVGSWVHGRFLGDKASVDPRARASAEKLIF